MGGFCQISWHRQCRMMALKKLSHLLLLIRILSLTFADAANPPRLGKILHLNHSSSVGRGGAPPSSARHRGAPDQPTWPPPPLPPAAPRDSTNGRWHRDGLPQRALRTRPAPARLPELRLLSDPSVPAKLGGRFFATLTPGARGPRGRGPA